MDRPTPSNHKLLVEHDEFEHRKNKKTYSFQRERHRSNKIKQYWHDRGFNVYQLRLTMDKTKSLPSSFNGVDSNRKWILNEVEFERRRRIVEQKINQLMTTKSPRKDIVEYLFYEPCNQHPETFE
eukprot:867308_1